MATRKSGRSSDPALTWFCHKLVSERVAEGVSQRKIAEVSRVPASAINRLLQKFDGVGPLSARQYATYFGYPDFASFVAATDAWWKTEGEAYARDQQRERLAAMGEAIRNSRKEQPPVLEILGPKPKKAKPDKTA